MVTHDFLQKVEKVSDNFLWSGMLYRPSKSLKKHGKSSSLHSKKIFLLWGFGFFLVTS